MIKKEIVTTDENPVKKYTADSEKQGETNKKDIDVLEEDKERIDKLTAPKLPEFSPFSLISFQSERSPTQRYDISAFSSKRPSINETPKVGLLLPVNDFEHAISPSSKFIKANGATPFGVKYVTSPLNFPFLNFAQYNTSALSANCHSQGNTPLNQKVHGLPPISRFAPLNGYADFSAAINEENNSHTPQFQNQFAVSPSRISREGPAAKPLIHSGVMSAFSPTHHFQ